MSLPPITPVAAAHPLHLRAQGTAILLAALEGAAAANLARGGTLTGTVMAADGATLVLDTPAGRLSLASLPGAPAPMLPPGAQVTIGAATADTGREVTTAEARAPRTPVASARPTLAETGAADAVQNATIAASSRPATELASLRRMAATHQAPVAQALAPLLAVATAATGQGGPAAAIAPLLARAVLSAEHPATAATLLEAIQASGVVRDAAAPAGTAAPTNLRDLLRMLGAAFEAPSRAAVADPAPAPQAPRPAPPHPTEPAALPATPLPGIPSPAAADPTAGAFTPPREAVEAALARIALHQLTVAAPAPEGSPRTVLSVELPLLVAGHLATADLRVEREGRRGMAPTADDGEAWVVRLATSLPAWGAVQARLRWQGGALRVVLGAREAATLAAMESLAEPLRAGLAAQGLEAEVTIVPWGPGPALAEPPGRYSDRDA